jgi:hypothetical protein
MMSDVRSVHQKFKRMARKAAKIANNGIKKV